MKNLGEISDPKDIVTKEYVDQKCSGGGVDESEDFIVEIGNDSRWSWRKWNSGFVELYGEYTFASGSWLGGSPLYYNVTAAVPLPFTLKKVYSCKWNVTNASAAVVVACMEAVRNLNTAFAYFLRAYGGNNSISITCQISVKGSIK